ncbi:hypothetical protein GIW25_05540 [Pseudomonas syringae]|nr:hypothetical protein [Pseudomonas syringae]
MILAEGRGSEPGDASLVRERASIIAENVSSEIPSSRTSSLPRPSGRSLKALHSRFCV